MIVPNDTLDKMTQNGDGLSDCPHSVSHTLEEFAYQRSSEETVSFLRP